LHFKDLRSPFLEIWLWTSTTSQLCLTSSYHCVFRTGIAHLQTVHEGVPRKEPERSNVNSSLKRCIRILIKFLHSIVSRMSKSPNKIASYFTQNLYNFQLFKTLSKPHHKYTTPARWYYIQVKLTEVVSQIAPTLFYFLLSRWARLRSSSNACIVSASNPPANCITQEKNQ
jgi:hypothetical protein